jgi:SAM-dependent methyltransferase
METVSDLRNNEYFEYIDCPICKSSDLSLHLSIPYGKLEQKPSLDYSCLGISPSTVLTVSKCRRCKFVFANPRVKAKHQEMIYNEAKRKSYETKKTTVAVGTDENFVHIQKSRPKYLPSLLKILSIADTNRPLKLFDFGCGFGHTLSLANALGIKGKGVEIDNRRLNYCRQLGLDVCTPEEFRQNFPHAKFDIIMCQSVIEHVIDLRQFLAFIDSISVGNTILYVFGVTPDLIKIESKRGKFVKAHFLEHVNYFYNSTLDTFMGKCRFLPYKKEVVILNSKRIFVPLKFTEVLGIRKGFFQRIYIKTD